MAKERTPSPWGPEQKKKAIKEMEEATSESLARQILRSLEKRGGEYRAYVRYRPDKSAFVCIGTIVGGHYSWNEQGYSIWVDAWERNPEWPRNNLLGIKEIIHGYGSPATLEGVMSALRYVNERFPDFTEETWVSNSIPVNIAVELGILVPD